MCDSALVGDSQNDEQGSDDLSNPIVTDNLWGDHGWEGTNLSLREDGQEISHNIVVGTTTPRPNNQRQAHSKKGTRLNEYDHNGLGRSTNSTYPHSSANAPCVQDESDDDHEGEEDVE